MRIGAEVGDWLRQTRCTRGILIIEGNERRVSVNVSRDGKKSLLLSHLSGTCNISDVSN